MAYTLYIANKNHSSWSLRPWVLMRELDIGFSEHLVRFGDEAGWREYRRISPAGKVPCLIDGPVRVWDTLAITEYLHERHPGVWPAVPVARAWARSAAAEMHSGFQELRSQCSMSCGIRVRLHQSTPGLSSDIARLSTLWSEGLQAFDGPFLAGSTFTAVDAFFAPVAFRVQTYGLALPADAQAYVERLLQLPSMRQWYAAALAETFRDAEHDSWPAQFGVVTQDLRASPGA